MQDVKYIGHSVKRLEDHPLLTGAGRFVADLRLPTRWKRHSCAARMPMPRSGIDTSAARRCPGVQAVFTLADLLPLLARVRLPLFRTAQLLPTSRRSSSPKMKSPSWARRWRS